MRDQLMEWMAADVERAEILGVGMARGALLWLLAGVLGRLFMLASVPGDAGPMTLAQALPGFPTFWVPETFVGCLPALGLLALARAMCRRVRTLQRIYY